MSRVRTLRTACYIYSSDGFEQKNIYIICKYLKLYIQEGDIYIFYKRRCTWTGARVVASGKKRLRAGLWVEADEGGKQRLAGRGEGEARKRDRARCGGCAKGWRGVAEGEKKNIGSERSPGTFRQINSGTH